MSNAMTLNRIFFNFKQILHINKNKYLKPYQDIHSNCRQYQFVRRNMISNNSFNTNDSNFSTYNISSLLDQEEEEESVDVPVIAISVSAAIIAVICGIGIAIEIRKRRRKMTRMSSTTSRNPIVDRGRYDNIH